MTVNTINSEAEFNTNGVTTNFPFYFKFLADEDLAVKYVNSAGAIRVLTPGTDYTVAGAGDEGGGSVTTTSAMPGPGQLIISREMDAYQQTSLRNQGKFLAETHEDVFDRLTMLIQQGFSLFSRALVRPLGSRFFDAKGFKISNMADGESAQDAVTTASMRAYVDQGIAGVKGGYGWFIQSITGAVQRTFQDKMRDVFSPLDVGAVGDGVADDSGKLAVFEAAVAGQEIDLGGRTFRVTSIPSGNKYSNGYWKVGSSVFAAEYTKIRHWNDIIVAGQNALPLFNADDSSSQSLIVMGRNAAQSATRAQGGIILGTNAHQFSVNIPYQTIAIGRGALSNVQPASSNLGETFGNRNIAIGAYCGLYMTTGYQNVMMGRNAGSGLTSGYQNTVLGTGAISGEAPVGLSGDVVNIKNMTGFRAVGIGYNAGKTAYEATDSVFIGGRAAQSLKSGTLNTIVGAGAAINLGNDTAINGNLYKSLATVAATYTQLGNTITVVTSSAHGAVVGDTVQLAFLTGGIASNYSTDLIYATVTAVGSATSFSVSSPVSMTDSGTCSLRGVIGQVAGSANGNNTFLGYASGASMVTAGGATVLGYRAAESLTSSTYGTFLGRYAGAVSYDGTPNTSYGTNVTAIGNASLLSGNNQVQLGNADTTVYYYQIAQRSDARDKTDVRDTLFGREFVRKLRFVDYRWDVRDAYLDAVETEVEDTVIDVQQIDTGLLDAGGEPLYRYERVSQVVTRMVESLQPVERDGSRARPRFHTGVIAQEFKGALEEFGEDSAAYQDHTIDGGEDIKTISYPELIPMIGRMAQETDEDVMSLTAEVGAQQAIIERLEQTISDLLVRVVALEGGA